MRLLQMFNRRFANARRALLCKSNRQKLDNMKKLTAHIPQVVQTLLFMKINKFGTLKVLWQTDSCRLCQLWYSRYPVHTMPHTSNMYPWRTCQRIHTCSLRTATSHPTKRESCSSWMFPKSTKEVLKMYSHRRFEQRNLFCEAPAFAFCRPSASSRLWTEQGLSGAAFSLLLQFNVEKQYMMKYMKLELAYQKLIIWLGRCILVILCRLIARRIRRGAGETAGGLSFSAKWCKLHPDFLRRER